MTDRTPTPNNDPDFDRLAAAWTAQPDTRTTAADDLASFAATTADAHRRDQRRLLWLNVQEGVPSLVIAAVFALSSAGAVQPWAGLVSAAIVLAVGAFLVATSVRHHRADRRFDGSLRAQLTRRLEQVRHRASLYRNVAWWYLLPLMIAVVLFRYGVFGEFRTESTDLVYYGVCLAVAGGLYLWNRRIGRTEYETEVERLETLLADFDRPA